ncbi:prolipoprotein diacylglyceryl transferase [Hominifimenecus sp. rT4P-3]|uniref:prolipoprotein diacylglyceryl transferase n=1 Tax=Hominifimenecus sp. rT4P-3 TaxID=3242979 RepID=UPI003DA24F4D
MRPILFSIGKLNFYSYGLMIAIGVLAAFWVMQRRAPKYGLDGDKGFNLGICCAIFGILGAKLLYIIVELPAFLENPALWKNIGEGFVVYGGIIGGIAGGWLYCHMKKLSFVRYFDLFMPSIALAQGFGRLGCLMAGCCYGKETSGWLHIVFPAVEACQAPTGVSLIPTQLISSAANFLHFFVLVWFAKKAKKDGQVGGMYLILYSVGRFFLEGLRNDPRGELGSLSTSQFISLFILALGVLIFLVAGKKGTDRTLNNEGDQDSSVPEASLEKEDVSGTKESLEEENASETEESLEEEDASERLGDEEIEKEEI